MRIVYDEVTGFNIFVERELMYVYDYVVPTYLSGEIRFSILEGDTSKELIDAFLVGDCVIFEDRFKKWTTLPVSLQYYMNTQGKALINFGLLVMGAK